jgi:hypothetical protein
VKAFACGLPLTAVGAATALGDWGTAALPVTLPGKANPWPTSGVSETHNAKMQADSGTAIRLLHRFGRKRMTIHSFD